MDERALSELLECSVCLESLDATSKVLPCQHTFCKRCLEEIVCAKNELRCPECRTLVNISVDELPTNILLIRLLEGMKTAKAGFSGGSPGASAKRTSPTSSRSGAGPSATAKTASPYKVHGISINSQSFRFSGLPRNRESREFIRMFKQGIYLQHSQ